MQGRLFTVFLQAFDAVSGTLQPVTFKELNQALISGGGYLLWSILGAFIIVGPFIATIRLIKMMNGVAEHYNVYGA